MLRDCLPKNSFRPKMSIKFISVVWNYHIVILKLLNCNSIAVFFLYFYLSKHKSMKFIKLYGSDYLNFWIIMNFRILWKNKYCILFVKNYLMKIMEDVAAGILRTRNFVISLSFLIYYILISQDDILRGICICSISPYFKPKETKDVYPCVSLINQVFVICSFTILHRLAQLCFTRAVLDLGDSRKWIIASLNRLVHWKVEFQSLIIHFKRYYPNLLSFQHS